MNSWRHNNNESPPTKSVEGIGLFLVEVEVALALAVDSFTPLVAVAPLIVLVASLKPPCGFALVSFQICKIVF